MILYLILSKKKNHASLIYKAYVYQKLSWIDWSLPSVLPRLYETQLYVCDIQYTIQMITGLLKVHAATQVLHYEEPFFVKSFGNWLFMFIACDSCHITHTLNKDVSLNGASSFQFLCLLHAFLRLVEDLYLYVML